MPVATLVQLSTITIDEPTPNETVSTTFTASGTYSLNSKSEQGWVMWQVQPAGDPPVSTEWQSTSTTQTEAEPENEGWDGSDSDVKVQARAWVTSATSTAGSRTFYAAVFTPSSQNPVALGSVNITVS